MQVNEFSKKNETIHSFEFEMKWLEFLDKLYYTCEETVLDLADKELQILCENPLYKTKLKAALLKNSKNIIVKNCGCLNIN